jgi:glycosyltransferase involved in cell wall biosynthesis
MSDRPSMPLVSIAIVAHNNWPDLELAIESALCQSWPNKEVIVIDNESADESPVAIAQSFGDRVRYVRQSNKLDGGGYNRGFLEARGEFVQLLDGDDLLAPNKIARQMATFTERPDADIVYGETRQFQGHAGRPSWSDWETTSHDDMLATLIDPAGEAAGLVIHSALFRKSVFERIGPWDESFAGADFDYWLRSAWGGCVFAFSKGAWCFHRRRAGQMSADAPVMLDRTVRTLQKALGYIDREPYLSMIKARLASLQYGVAVTDLRLDKSAAKKELRASRMLDPKRISALHYAMGLALLIIPGARLAMKSGPLTSGRRRLARAFGIAR